MIERIINTEKKIKVDNKELYVDILEMQGYIIKKLDKIERFIKVQVFFKFLKYIIIILLTVLSAYYAIPLIQNFYDQYIGAIEQINNIKSGSLINVFK